MLTTPEPTDTQATLVAPRATDAWTAVDDRRDRSRLEQELGVKLVGLGSTEAIPCTVKNLAEGGFFVHASATCGLSVGQRYEFVVDDETVPPELDGAMMNGFYATVVRTELLYDAPERMMGAGLRFDQPLAL